MGKLNSRFAFDAAAVSFLDLINPIHSQTHPFTLPIHSRLQRVSKHFCIMAAPSAASGVKRERDSPATVPPLARWDHLLPVAEQAADAALAARDEATAAARRAFIFTDQNIGSGADHFRGAFQRAIHNALPGDRSQDESDFIRVDSDIAWIMRDRDALGYSIAERLAKSLAHRMVYRAAFVHQIRRIHSQHPAVWDATLAVITGWARDSRFDWYAAIAQQEPNRRAEAESMLRVIHATFAPSIERTRFDASQLERHMSMTHRVPADVTNLIGQFATTGITTQSPIPLRLQTKHKLELLTRRVASLTAAQVAAELRDILGDVEEALPEDERTLKKARK